MKKICVTGANGFIGKPLCKALISSGRSIQGLVRALDLKMKASDINYLPIGNIESKVNWKDYLHGNDCVIHCAGKTHSMYDRKNLDDYLLINTEYTKFLAKQASEAGVRRFIFLSSIKVNGESTSDTNNLKIFTNTDMPYPDDNYSISKFEAEKALWDIASNTGLEVVIVRAPLVYGFDVKGNLKNLMKLIQFRVPLPFSLIKNKRSLIGIDNLVNLLVRCIDHPDAKGKTFLVSDDEDLSTPKLIKYIELAMGRKSRMFPFPTGLLKIISYIIGRQTEMNRLISNLQVDCEYTKKTLNWSPPVSAKEGIRRMVQGL